MKKLLCIVLSCLMLLGSAAALAEAEPPAVKIAVAFYQIDAAALQVQDYLQNYVGPQLNVTFMFSEAIDNVDKLMNFMDNAYAAGCDGIMNYQNSAVEQAVSKTQELGMYIASNTTNAVENGDIPFNMGMAAADAQYCAQQFGGMVADLFADGEIHNVVIVSAGAGMGNNEHKYSTIAILEMLQNIYGLTYEEDVENLATTRSQIDCANDKGVLITIYPGYPTGDTYVPGMSTILQTGKYDTVLACNAAYAKFSVAIDEVEKATGTNIRVSAITAINDTTKSGFNTIDSTGNPSLDSAILMPSVSTASALFALVYNGVTGYGEQFRQDDLGYYYNSPKWVCPNAENYARLEKINTSDDTWEVSMDELKQMLALFIPDAEPRLFGDRVYIYGSHDAFGGEDYCVNDYVCWSAPAEDLSDWRYEGVIYTRSQDPQSPRGERKMQAPDVVRGPDGRYYMYYTLDLRGEVGPTSVAVCDTPAGRYEYAGMVSWLDGHALGSREGELLTFDPGVLVDDDGRVYLFTGIAVPDIPPLRAKVAAKKRVADGCYLVELDRDMMTVVGQPKRVLTGFDDAAGTPFEGHAFFEASSPRRISGRYYIFYCSQRSHELCYALSEQVDGPYRYGGTVVSIGDVGLDGRTEDAAVNYLGNTHGGLLTVNGRHYISYHRQTNLIQYARQGCMEPVTILPDGTIPQVRITSSGLHDGPLPGLGSYEARIACCLRSREGVFAYKVFPTPPGIHPYLTQDTPDHMGRSDQYVANLRDGAYAGFRSFDLHGPVRISAVVRGSGEGTLAVSASPEGEALAEIPVQPCDFWHAQSAAMAPAEGVHDLYFTFHGTGAVDFFSFTLA